MRAVLDACVLFPTVMRETLIGAAALGAYQPIWSDRILEEWARATRRLPKGSEEIARGEIALLKAQWKASQVNADEEQIASLELPDRNDRHVLATAISSKADVLITRNRSDFPARVLRKFGIMVRDPDEFLVNIHHNYCDLSLTVQSVRKRAEVASGREQPIRALFKRAGLPKLGKTFDGLGGPANVGTAI